MAKLYNHEISAVYQHKENKDIRWHVDRNGAILRTTGPRNGKGKMLMLRTTANGLTHIYVGLRRRFPGDVDRRAYITDPSVQAMLAEKFVKVEVI